MTRSTRCTMHVVLNACRHQRNNHITDLTGCAGLIATVLNACRHQRNNHAEQKQCSRRIRRCSTPVGIKGTITRCSGRLREVGQLSVLNACRHQRNNHVRIASPQCLRCRLCAQRLSASKEQSRARSRSVMRNVSGAQRLSASKEQSRINAPFGIPALPKCSTPVGIKGTITKQPRLLRRAPAVLNACRHQRNNHKCPPPPSEKLLVCSTPVGIKGTITSRV